MIYVKDIIDKFNGKLLCGDINLVLDNFLMILELFKKGIFMLVLRENLLMVISFIKMLLKRGLRLVY